MEDRSALDAKAQHCAVVVCTYNGSQFLQAQLDSIAAQSLPPDTILISDDGSTDQTREVAKAWAANWTGGKAIICDGPQKGFAANFLSALSEITSTTQYVALSDQDDIWFPDKLARAVKALGATPSRPALYGSATLECDFDLKPNRISRRATVDLTFNHAIGQNFAGGNTMLLNAAALKLVQAANDRGIEVPVHDWWLYQLISGAGGNVLFDPEPSLYYRQHGANQIGSAAGIMAMSKRLRRMARGDYRGWNTANLHALDVCKDMLTASHADTLNQVIRGRDAGLRNRLSLLRDPGLYRQGLVGQMGLALALALRRY